MAHNGLGGPPIGDAGPASISRDEEVLDSSGEEGPALQLSPIWLDAVLWVTIASVILATVYSVTARVSEYATGPAVVRFEDRVLITAPASGIVSAVAVTPGQHVQAGSLLLRFDDSSFQAELRSVDTEMDLELLSRLRDPVASPARAFAGIEAHRQLVRARISDLSLRAPVSGVVGDVRTRPGQRLEQGEIAITLTRYDSAFSVVAVLPGQYRPLLRVGDRARFRVTGPDPTYQELTIDELGDDVVGPAEVRHYLGPQYADALAVSGAVVLTKSLLKARTFEARGRVMGYFDGMQGQVEVPVRSERLLVYLLPMLKDTNE